MMTAEQASLTQKSAPKQFKGAHSVFKAIVGRCGTLVLNTGTGIITARVLRPEGRGELAAMILWPVFLSGACTLGLPNALLYTLRMRRRGDDALVTTALIIALVLSAVTAILGFILIPHWLVHYSAEVVRTAQWFMVSTPATILLLVGRAAWEARGRFGTSAACLLAPPVITLASLLLLLGTHHLTPISGAWSYVLGGAAPVVWVVVSLRSDIALRWKEMLIAAQDLMSYGLRSFGIDLCGSLAQYVDQALVIGMLMPSQMGTYTVALSLSRMVNVIFASVASVVFPKAMGRDAAGGLRLALRAVVGSLALGIPAATVLALGSGFALRSLYGAEYSIASGLLQVLLLEALVSGSVSVMSQPFMAQGRPGTVTVLQVIGLATSVPLIFFLVPRMGPEGACVALLISACLRMVLLRYYYSRVLPQDVSMTRQALSEAKEMMRLARRKTLTVLSVTSTAETV